MTEEELIGNLLGTTASKTRRKVIPPNIALEVGNFRRDLLDLEDDPGYITVLIQDVGRLAMAGQYGYVDLLNEQYIKYSDFSSPKAVSFARVRVEIYSWLECIKKDFFASEIEAGDLEEAQVSINDVEAMYMWARLTDQYEVEDIINRIQETLDYMYTTFNKRKEQN